MYLGLSAQFESWLHPATIMLSLPRTLPFAFLSVVLFRRALGILVLFGVVKKNAILPIDHTNGLRRHGMERMSAILKGEPRMLAPGRDGDALVRGRHEPTGHLARCRLGLQPGHGGGVVGWQIFSLLLTLLATPVAYSQFGDLSVKLRRLFRVKAGEFASEEQPAPAE